MASYWIALFTVQYAENRDTIFISMKTFNDKPMDKYPTFSLCFIGDKFHWYRDDKIFDSYALNATQYELLLKGELAQMDELNETSRLYGHREVTLNDASDVKFDNIYVKASDFLYELKYASEQDEYIVGFP